MGARDHTELIVWQLANELCLEVFPLTARNPWARDFKLRAQTKDAASSCRRNIAEGFGRHSHPEFARFLEISASSRNELRDCLLEAEQQGYVTAGELAGARNLIHRLTVATSRFMRYLLTTPTPPRYQRREQSTSGTAELKNPKRQDATQHPARAKRRMLKHLTHPAYLPHLIHRRKGPVVCTVSHRSE